MEVNGWKYQKKCFICSSWIVSWCVQSISSGCLAVHHGWYWIRKLAWTTVSNFASHRCNAVGRWFIVFTNQLGDVNARGWWYRNADYSEGSILWNLYVSLEMVRSNGIRWWTFRRCMTCYPERDNQKVTPARGMKVRYSDIITAWDRLRFGGGVYRI